MTTLRELRFKDRMLSRKFLFSILVIVLQSLLVFFGVLPANLYADIVSTTIFAYLGSNVANKFIETQGNKNNQ